MKFTTRRTPRGAHGGRKHLSNKNYRVAQAIAIRGNQILAVRQQQKTPEAAMTDAAEQVRAAVSG